VRRVLSFRTRFRWGIGALLVTLTACYFGFTKDNPFSSPFKLSAAFRTSNDIKAGSAVRIAGVNVGKVTAVRGGGGGSIVEMEIQESGLPIHRDARAKVRPRIFLEGNWFVELQPGSPSSPVAEEGYTLPVQQTAAPVQFGQVLTALQSDTRQDLQVVLDEYGRALADGGAKAYNRTIDHWKGAYRDSAIVNEAMLGVEEHDLSGYLRGAGRFARGLDRDPQALKSLLTDLATTADAFASEERALGNAIHELPRFLRTGRSALGELNSAFPPLRRFVADLRPAVRSSGPALDATLPLVRQLRGLVTRAELRGLTRELRRTVPELTELNVEGIGLQKQLRLLSSCANTVLTPWRQSKVGDPNFEPSGPVFEEQVKWLPGIAAESRAFDANGQYVRTLANGANYAYPLNDGRFFATGLPLMGVNPPKMDKAPPLDKHVPCETQEPPDLESKAQAAPRAIKVDHSSERAIAAEAKARAKAVDWLRDDVKQLGLDLPVADEALSLADLPKLKGGVK
jgi:phospholipid/cholesterol/gamma-HCH transport system substrate-binding protein